MTTTHVDRKLLATRRTSTLSSSVMASTTTTTTTTRLSNPSKSRLPSTSLLSSSEMQYILEGCRDNIRLDGRARDDIRPYTLLQSPLALSNGSSRIISGTTHVLCSCKAELVHPSPDFPNRGTVELHIDTLLSGQQQQQRGGGGGGGRSREEWLTSLLEKLWSHDLEGHLVVVPHVYVWRLCVDVLVLFHNGSLADICSRVIRAALQNTKLAHITPLLHDSSGSSSSQKDKRVELSVDGDMKNAVEIPLDCPLIVTVFVLDQNVLLVDATLEEEACASCQVKVAIDSTGQVRGVFNQGPLHFFLKDDIIAMAIQASKKMFHQETLATVDTEDGSLLQSQYKFR